MLLLPPLHLYDEIEVMMLHLIWNRRTVLILAVISWLVLGLLVIRLIIARPASSPVRFYADSGGVILNLESELRDLRSQITALEGMISEHSAMLVDATKAAALQAEVDEMNVVLVELRDLYQHLSEVDNGSM
jgi:hypothetical protein